MKETVLEEWAGKMFLCGSLGQLKIACCVPPCPFYGLSGQVESYGEAGPEIPGNACDQDRGTGWFFLLLKALALVPVRVISQPACAAVLWTMLSSFDGLGELGQWFLREYVKFIRKIKNTVISAAGVGGTLLRLQHSRAAGISQLLFRVTWMYFT